MKFLRSLLDCFDATYDAKIVTVKYSHEFFEIFLYSANKFVIVKILSRIVINYYIQVISGMRKLKVPSSEANLSEYFLAMEINVGKILKYLQIGVAMAYRAIF